MRALQHERGEERDKTNDAAQQCHRAPRDENARKVQGAPVGFALRRRDVLGSRDAQRGEGAREEHQRRDAQDPLAAGQLEDRGRRQSADQAREYRDQCEARVREHEFGFVFDDGGHE